MKHLPYIASIFFYLMLYSCANIVAPSGGEKDSLAPIIKIQTPENQSVNFNSDKIVIEFNEYIEYSYSSNSLIISPPMSVTPDVNIKGKKLEIIFQETLEPNTTYTLNFGDNVKDWNEGNPYKGLQYIFSTGNKLDSTSLQGKVLSADEKSPMENIQVMLYKESKDSILIKAIPYYVTQTDASGAFSFSHLKAGTYQIAALLDNNFNYLYDQTTEQIAFLDKTIILSNRHKLNEDLLLFSEKQEFNIVEEIVQKGYVQFAFSEAIESIAFDTEIYTDGDIAYLSQTNDTLHFWYQADVEQATIYLTINDTQKDTISLDLRKAIEEPFSVKSNGNELPINKEYILHFNSPISTYDMTKMTLLDSTNTSIPFAIKKDDNKQLTIEANWQKGMRYTFSCSEEAVSNFLGKKTENKEFTISIVEEKSNGNLILTFESKEENLVLQLLDKDKKQLEKVNIKGKTAYTFIDVNPGSYFIKVFEDKNNNGNWDTGSFDERQQPESIRFISTAIEMKTNWDKEINIDFE